MILHPSTLHSISSVQVNLPHNHKSTDKTVEMMYFELLKRFDGGKSIPLLDPVCDMEIESKALGKLNDARATLEKELQSAELK